MKNKINLKDVINQTKAIRERKVPRPKSDNHIEWLCRRYGLIFSFKDPKVDHNKMMYTYKYILNKINRDGNTLELIIKHYSTISKLYQYFHPEHHSLYFNLFFVKDHLKLVLDSVRILNTFNHYVDWITLKYFLEKEGEEYEELKTYEDSFSRKKRTGEREWTIS
jgi:hypothetical protein